MRFIFEKDAGPGTCFGETAFDSQIGKQIPVEVAPGVYQQGTIRSAEVINDGRTARLEVELPDSDEVRAALRTPLTDLSIGTRP